MRLQLAPPPSVLDNPKRSETLSLLATEVQAQVRRAAMLAASGSAAVPGAGGSTAVPVVICEDDLIVTF